MKIAVLCNSPLAIPSIQLLKSRNCLGGIAVPLIFHPFPFEMELLAATLETPFSLIQKPSADAELESWIGSINPDVVFVMLWPSKISTRCLNIPRFGFFNWHPGLLPEYRGPDPIFWEIRNREPVGGITVHKMTDQFDDGPIAFIERIPIEETDTYSDHLKKLSASAVKTTEWMLSSFPKISLVQQEESRAHYHRSPTLADRTIDWKQDAASILALIRACEVYGGATTHLRNSPISILCASARPSNTSQPGQIICTAPLTIGCGNSEMMCVEQISTGSEPFAPKTGEILG